MDIKVVKDEQDLKRLFYALPEYFMMMSKNI